MKRLAFTRLPPALRAALVLVGVLWAIQLLNWLSGQNLNRLGIWPRHGAGLPGIGLAPLLHGSFSHLLTNTVPLFFGTLGLWWLAPRRAVVILALIWTSTGALVWLLGRPLIHLGASGLIFGLLAFDVTRGLQRRDGWGTLLALAVTAAYAPLLFGVLPSFGPVSWESHLAGLVAGVAIALRGPGDDRGRGGFGTGSA